jgi:hypothetical protein
VGTELHTYRIIFKQVFLNQLGNALTSISNPTRIRMQNKANPSKRLDGDGKSYL